MRRHGVGFGMAVLTRDSIEASVQRTASTAGLVGWALVDWAQQPFYSLVLTFLFAPYFTTAVAGNPAHGQALWAYAAAAGGILIAVGSPILGAIADNGRRKPWVALSASIVMAGMAALWFAVPKAEPWTLFLVLAAFVSAMACAEFTAVFTNSLMPELVPPSKLGRLSGIGWAVGYAGGLVSLIVIAGFLVANPATGKTLLGLDPLLKLDAATREGDRFVGPFAAAWLFVFILPFFIFTPDARPHGDKKSVGAALAALWQTVKGLPAHPAMLLFLLARAIFADGLSAIFVFGGIYGTTVFDWQPFERGLFGIVLIVAGVIGAFLGGFLDDRLGAKRVILGALLVLLAAAVGILSVDKTHVFYTLTVPPKVAGGTIPFASIGEIVFMGFAVLVSLVSAPVGASSRSLLARLAPEDKMAQYFGLFAFSGKATAFLAPLLVAFVTDYTHDQRVGMASILGFLAVGFLMMLGVRERRSEV